uniref:Uncharacterized protein n=1 Tax=Aegilops tauschii subsp. strangulata TaxID=200361 RepID=A0A453EJI5_AEGTS
MHLRFQWIPVEAMWSSACMLSVSWMQNDSSIWGANYASFILLNVGA